MPRPPRTLATVVSVLLGCIVVLAAAAKLDDPYPAAAATSWLINRPVDALRLVQALATFELIVGAFVIAGSVVNQVPILVSTLVVGFIVWDVARWAAGGEASCGCLGSVELPGGWWGVALKDVVLLVAAMTVGRPVWRVTSIESVGP